MVFANERRPVSNPTDPGKVAHVGVLVNQYFDAGLTVEAESAIARARPGRTRRERRADTFG
jgi:hypothetical protein